MRVLSGVPLAVASVITLVSVTGCSQMAQLSANRAFKAANQAYQTQDYEKAATFYEEALAANPDLNAAHFFLANSYDNQFRPARKGEPENDAKLQKAVDHYKIAADKLLASESEDDKNLGKLSLEYLAATYSVEKLNDPASAEPVWQKMIQLEPDDPGNYFALARLYDEAGAYPEAEQMLLKARDISPNDPAVYQQLANFYNTKGEFEKTMDAWKQRAEREPTNPEAFFVIATYYWDYVRVNSKLGDAEKRELVGQGLNAIEKALSLKSDYVDAMVYKGLLLRQQATVERDRAKVEELIKQAEGLASQATEIRKRQAGAS